MSNIPQVVFKMIDESLPPFEQFTSTTTYHWYNTYDLATMSTYEMTPLTLFYCPPFNVLLKWFRVLYTTVLTVAARWVFVMSDVNYVSWHLHNTALISALTGMWLVTMSNFVSTPNKYFNTLANDFYLTALPSMGVFSLVFSVLYTPQNLTTS